MPGSVKLVGIGPCELLGRRDCGITVKRIREIVHQDDGSVTLQQTWLRGTPG